MHSKISKINPVNLLSEYLENPIGIHTQKPRFSWQLHSQEKGQLQTGYRILVAESIYDLNNNIGQMWDSGKIESDRSTQVEYKGKRLFSFKRYYWKICSWDGAHVQSRYSEVSYFEMGLLEENDWSGKWIGGDESISSPLFRKSFKLNHKVKNARAYICGLGYYELYINGNRVGDHVLDPNYTNYDDRNIEGLLYPFEDRTRKRVLYVTYDITSCLKQGDNCIGVILGNGWYNQRERTIEGKMSFGYPKLLFQVVVEQEDGSKVEITSDGTWKFSEGPITFNNIFYGEIYDARLEKSGWENIDFDDSGWKFVKLVQKPTGMLCSQLSPADKVIRVIKPVGSHNPFPGVIIYDMGENFTGWIRIRVCGIRGTKVVMRFAEEIDENGILDFASSGGVDQIQMDTYILKGNDTETYEPRFTWHGFRYAEIVGLPGVSSIGDVEGVVVHSAITQAGSFKCSNELFNQINQNYIRSQLGNLHGGVPSDCPHRERLGYTGDGHLCAQAAIFGFDMAQFYTKWINDISDAQNQNTGFVPHTAPFSGGGGGPAWGCAIIILPWLMFMNYGDIRVLEQHYERMKHWLQYLGAAADNDFTIIREEPGGWFLGDWCVPGGVEAIKLPSELVNTFYYGYVVRLMSRIAEVLGNLDDSGNFRILEQNITNGFNQKFLNPNVNSYSIGRQGSEVFPMALGIVPENIKPFVLEHLVKNITEDCSGCFDTGIFATPLLLDVLTENGYEELAYRLLNKTAYPSFGYMIEKGATTLWENWDGSESHNHPMFGSVTAWFYKVLAGINTDLLEPGFKSVIIKPYFISDLTYVNASLKTLVGEICVDWERQEKCIKFHVGLPVNSHAKIHISKKEINPYVIFENGQTVWKKGVVVQEIEGITGFGEDEESVIIYVLSGEYRFEINW